MRIFREDILNYLSGKLSDKDRYAFEKKMLEDPFLNDAVEGLQSVEDPEAISSLLDQLDLEIETKSKRSRSSGNSRWITGVAAVLIIVITSVLILYFPLNPQKEHLSLNQIPEVQEPVQEKDIVPEGDLEYEETPEKPTAAQETVEVRKEIQPEPVENLIGGSNKSASEEDGVKPNEIIIAQDVSDEQVAAELMVQPEDEITRKDEKEPEVVREDEITLKDEKDNEDVIEEESIENKKVAEKSMPTMIREETDRFKSKSSIKSNLQPEIFNGIVTGPSSQGLSGVNVISLDRGNGAITNEAGEFQFNDYDIGLNLLFTKTEYLDKKMSLTGQFTDISLEEATGTVNYEVVSTGYFYFDQIPTPHIGRERYLVYLNDQIELINDELNIKETIPTVVEMQINALGEITNLKIISTNNILVDDRTLKIVRVGSDWIPAIVNGRSIEATIHIKVTYRGK